MVNDTVLCLTCLLLMHIFNVEDFTDFTQTDLFKCAPGQSCGV